MKEQQMLLILVSRMEARRRSQTALVELHTERNEVLKKVLTHKVCLLVPDRMVASSQKTRLPNWISIH